MRKVGAFQGFAVASLVHAVRYQCTRLKRDGFWQLKFVTELRATESAMIQHKTAESLKQMLKAVWIFYSRRVKKCFHCWISATKQQRLDFISYRCERLAELTIERKMAGFYAILTQKQAMLERKCKASNLFNRIGQALLRKNAFEDWRRAARYRAYKAKLDAQLKLFRFRVGAIQNFETKVLACLYNVIVRSLFMRQASALLHWQRIVACEIRWEVHLKEASDIPTQSIHRGKDIDLDTPHRKSNIAGLYTTLMRESLEVPYEVSRSEASTMDSVIEGEVKQELLEMLKNLSFNM